MYVLFKKMYVKLEQIELNSIPEPIRITRCMLGT